ncbi:unnamed protein product [Somion occarium]|uniref:Trafficking protein particle complex II-specific subunit 65 IgD3 domain-containing protein n=2 Tax=Somion occarium TaxID=3059160 RepID=A0ABP1DDU8_9APHY
MSNLEEYFNSAVLDVITPIVSVGFPPHEDIHAANAWLEAVEDENVDRNLAFFDENLAFVLLLRFGYEQFDEDGLEDTKPRKPPISLLSFLAHLQISWDASYISSLPPPPSPSPTADGRPPVPSRTVSIPKTKATSLMPVHPSIFPPSTPHPLPSTGDADRQYVQAQGTPLRFGVWGENSNLEDAQNEDFALLWSEKDKTWVAVYKMTVQVSFMPTRVPDPLLCLTVSTTLREKPLAFTPPRKPLAALIEAAGGLPDEREPGTPLKVNGDDDDEGLDVTGLEEVNLLEGLKIDPTFASESLNLPTTRLAPSVRMQSYSLPPVTPNPDSPGTSTSTHTISRTGTSTHTTLRKSFRKTMRTVSGFRVRMRTVFVPYFMLPPNGTRKSTNGTPRKSSPDTDSEESDLDDEEHLNERELREAGNEEHTVVLCVEVENGGESSAGFAVESVNVSVGGEGAQTRLIGWGESGLSQPEKVFPLLLNPMEQYNLLYAVSFLRSPETDEFSLAKGRGLPGTPAIQDLQRAVTIIINGRPYDILSEDGTRLDLSQLNYPTPTFPSRWNCVLDLSPQSQATVTVDTAPEEHTKIALPTPASPFPGSASRPMLSAALGTGGLLSPMPAAFQTPRGVYPKSPGTPTPTGAGAMPSISSIVAGSKRYTLSAMDADMVSASVASSGGDSAKFRGQISPVNYRSGPAMLNPANQRDTLLQSGTQATTTAPINPILSATAASNRNSYLPPSVTVQSYMQSPTTYGPLSPPLPPVPGAQSYGSFGSRRAAGLGLGHGQEDSVSSAISLDMMVVPPTPAYPAYPTSQPLPPTPRWQGPITNLQSGAVGPSVEIKRERGGNVGIPPTPGPMVGAGGGFAQMQMQIEAESGGRGQGEGDTIVVSVGLLPMRRFSKADGTGAMRKIGKIYPLDQFTLDIFVFNQSSRTRRFEVSYPDRRKRRKEQVVGIGHPAKKGEGDAVGIVPLENRVRIGPLLPSTCQSVRMDFLALSPGVHSVDTLTLTDIQTGYTMNLRSVLDVVIHEHEITQDKERNP